MTDAELGGGRGAGGLGWGGGGVIEWPHSRYITTNMNGFSDGILC